jgi:hypothetical protein
MVPGHTRPEQSVPVFTSPWGILCIYHVSNQSKSRAAVSRFSAGRQVQSLLTILNLDAFEKSLGEN